MVSLPHDFEMMLKDLLDKEAPDLIASLNCNPVVSVRVNKRKPVTEFTETQPVKWCKSGLYLKERPEFTLDPLLHAGAYYVQEASSMIYETVLEELLLKFPDLATLKNGRILDLCAAPGGKTTALINAVPDGWEITANEYSPKRVEILKENLYKWGYPNILITNKDSNFYAKQGENFDIVAVDAPCSGEGMMRKEEMARKQWSWQLVEKCASLQKEILSNAEQALKPGGFLIYSTCTFNRKENEENAEFLSSELKLNPVDPGFPQEWGISKGIQTELPVYRFFPHKIKGEGLFLAVFRKPGELENSNKKRLTKENNPIFQNSNSSYLAWDVSREVALAYLRRECIILPPEAPKGLINISYKGLTLGPVKNIGTRANNLYPKNWRILKR